MDSLRARLTLSAGLVLAAFLALAGLALDRAHQRSVEAGVRQRLEARVYVLLGAAELGDAGELRMPDSLAEPRFGQPDSGLYAAIRDADGDILWRSPSSLGRGIDYPAADVPGRPVHARIEPPDAEKLRALAYPVTWEIGDRVRQLDFLVAESAAAAEARIAAFRRTLQIWLGAVAAALLVLQTVVLTWGLRPLRRAAREVAAIQAGERERLGPGYPRELRPLTQNLNELLAGSRARMQRYRDALSDLAHSLKTPLAVLRSLDTDAGVREHADRIERAIAWHVQRAATAGRSGLIQPVALPELVDRVAGALDKVHAGKAVALERDLPGDAVFHGDSEDLMEIVGNLLDNAYKWCAGRVRLRARPMDEPGQATPGLRIEVEDDGPGIPGEQRRAVLGRGVRVDELVPGEGIGLAVVRRMVEEDYGGTIEVGDAELGGARVVVQLPGR